VTRSRSLYERRGKRALDVTLATVGIVVTSPVLVAAAVAVRASLGSPVLFRQVRPGLNAQPFTILKLRTMLAPSPNGPTLPDADRLTPLGRVLRSSSIDELPELINVLKGDMSLVGPRPLLVEYLDRYSPEQARRHDVRPGLTGWSQVMGRNSMPWGEKLALDTWYVDNVSWSLDLRIIWLTVLTVLTRTGISADGHATMPEFAGEG